MLQSIRDRTQGWIAGTIISLLILSFGLWGIHSYLSGAGDNSTVATVNGVTITQNQLGAAYDRLHRQVQMQLNAPNLSSGAETNLKQRALQGLIDTQVFKQSSLHLGYRISSLQVDNYLQGMSEFQVNGEFSLSRFQEVLNATLYSAADFLDLIKTKLLIDQPRLGLIFTSFALPNEVMGAGALVEQQRNFDYFIIPFNHFSDAPITLTDSSIQTYYAQHQDNFKTPEQVSIEYVELSMQDEEKLADTREKLANLTYEHPDSLKTAAQELNLTVKITGLFTRDKGGDTLTKNSKIRSAAFSNDVLHAQNNSDVIEVNPSSFIVLRVKSHMPAAVLPLSSVKEEIVTLLKQQAIEEKTAALADKIQNEFYSGALTKDQATKKYQWHWKQGGFVNRRSQKVDPSILDVVFQMKKPDVNKPGYAITKLKEGYAVIELNAIKAGVIAKPSQQYQAFAEQIQNSQGLFEYALYQNSLMDHAKIVKDTN